MQSREQLRKVAIYCDEYDPKTDGALKSISDYENPSCVHCIHFTRDNICDLDLIDPILSSLAMEEDLKS